ncbi:MAG: hypothetical protein ACRCW5_02545, partial [Cetobacterium sp.]|uniref:hypothetical protein n=1 Tax=Cetobacterium sp. TaxID=2071632 RepID=UPI003F3D17FB
MDSEKNAADDITRGKSLKELTQSFRWANGPDFLYQSEASWPILPAAAPESDTELKKSTLCLHLCTSPDVQLPGANHYNTWKNLIKATVACLHGAAQPSTQTDETKHYLESERLLLQQAQRDSFPEEFKALSSNRPLPANSWLVSLSPEYDEDAGLIRVGGRLRLAEHIDLNALHPIVLDPNHQITKLLIKECDANLFHPGPERVLAELRRHYW